MSPTFASLFRSLLLLLAISASAVSAAPASRQQQQQQQQQQPGKTAASGNVKQMGPPNGQAVGAAYFITDDPQGNFIVAADIGNDGKLSLRRAIDTGGLGQHGQSDPPNGPDPLFTQGAIKASSAGNVVATVNPGSNTLSVFSIDPADPTNLNMLGRPIGSGGEFPVSLALSKAGDALCALNGGEVNGVNCFSISKNGLTPLSSTARALNINQTTPATGPAGSVSHIVFTEDGKNLVVSVKGVPPTPGFLAVWDVVQNSQGSGFSLSPDFKQITAPQPGGLLPFSMTVIPGQNAILATDAGIGFDIFDFADGNAQGGNGSRGSSAIAIDGQSATCWSSFSKKTGNFYLTDIGTSLVTEVSVDKNTLAGKIVKQYDQGKGSATIDNDIVSVGNNDFMFVLAANATSINVLALNAPGQAKNIQKVDLAGPAKRAGLNLDASNIQGMTTFLKQ